MMDSRIGLDFIVENPEYIRKLAAALDTTNVTVKKQVFELLSALCVYNEEGHARALETLEQYKKLKSERYRLAVIVAELDRATVVEYQTALVAFINCIIISTFRLSDRIRLRNEFVGCHLLPVLNNLRKCAEAEPELAVQLDVFDEQRDSDEAQCLQGPHGVDLSSPLDVFYAILKQVTETPLEVPFLAILQHLLRIDNREPMSDIVWDTAERLVHRATLIESREQASLLLRTPSFTGISATGATSRSLYGSTSPQQCGSCGGSMGNRRPSGGGETTSSAVGLVPPPPPLPPVLLPLPPPPPPPPEGNFQSSYHGGSSLVPSHAHHQTQQHPSQLNQCLAASGGGNQRLPQPHQQQQRHPHHAQMQHNQQQLVHIHQSQAAHQQSMIKLPQQEIPQPKIKMKTFNWNKIPSNKVVGIDCIWQQVACNHQCSPMTDMDWTELEGLFCQQTAMPSAHSSPKLGNRSDSNSADTLDRRLRKDNSEITLLDGKRSLNVNIFLKQFRSSNDDIVQLIKDGAHDDIGSEKLKGLLKILPEVDELDMLKLFDGDFNKLGNAEKFIIQLTNLPKYKLRIECMLLKEEFAANMSYLEPSINSMIIAAQDLMTNKPLKEVLYMVLVAGNFLNSGGYAGDAAGVKLSCLQKITDIRANKPNMNLIHFVAIQAEKRNKDLLTFTDNISVLEDAAKTTVEQLHNEINALDVRIKKIRKQIDNPSTEIDIKHQMIDFLLVAEREVANLQRVMVHLEDVRCRLAEFFCDDTATFKLEECFRVFHGFYCKWRQAVAENERRRAHEEQAVIRKRQREELLATKRRQMGTIGTPDSDGNYMDTQIYDSKTGFPMKKGKRNPSGGMTSEEEISIAGSPSMTRRRLGSFNGGQSSDGGGGIAVDKATSMSGKDDRSPDITPNGSLRRRRSRVLSEEDEGNLMEFLRTSGHDNNRERKSWGSLDRSWARRARGVSSRKRPALLTPDSSEGATTAETGTFVPMDQARDRPNSPRLAADSQTTPSTPTTPASTSALGSVSVGGGSDGGTRPREWRQKIESWLKANEKGSGSSASSSGLAAGGSSGERDHSHIDRKNRRSLELDSESDRSNCTLDTLPEGKQVYSDSQTSYRRTYPDWKPSHTIDNTDVVSAMETVEEVQPPYVKDKSAWRKSNLNVANSTEATRPRDSSLPLYSYSNIINNNDAIVSNTSGSATRESDLQQQRKDLITSLGQRPATDRLTVYIRRPSCESGVIIAEASSKVVTPPGELDQLLTKTVRVTPVPDSPPIMEIDGGSNKDIDQDNIETPPATRRIFTPTPTEKREPTQPTPCKRMLNRTNATSSSVHSSSATNVMQIEQDVIGASPALGDGQFDRFSAARRTRRFKRNTDSMDTITPTTSATDLGLSITLTIDTTCSNGQQHISQDIPTKESPNKIYAPSIVALTQDPVKRGRKYNINMSNSCRDEIKTNIDSKDNSESMNNDEGFEETQSLQSEESPSQGETCAGSAAGGTGNEDKNTTVVLSNTSVANVAASKKKHQMNGALNVGKVQPQMHAPWSSSRFNRNSIVRQTTQEQSTRKPLLPLSPPSTGASIGARRTNSMRKPISTSDCSSATAGVTVQFPRRGITANTATSAFAASNIQRSNSKSSVVSSSRSSLTSTGTTGTVIAAPRRSPLKSVNSNCRTPKSTNSAKSVVSSLSVLTGNSGTTANTQQSSVIGKLNSTAQEGAISNSRQSIVRSNGLSFMKPTASSTTKTTTVSVVPSRLHSSFKLKY